MAEPIYGFNSRDKDRIGRAVRQVERGGTPSLGGSSEGRRGLGNGVVLIRINSSTALHANQFEYAANIVTKNDKYASPDNVSGEAAVKAYNWYEFGNDASTTVVNGITLDADITGVKAVPAGKVFPAIVLLNSDGQKEYWFTCVNEWNVGCS